MELRQLGQTKIHVTPVILGTWAIGGWLWGGTDRQDSIAAIQASIDAGVTTIDTAPIYGMGESERLIAEAIKGRRDKVVIATKCGMRWDSDEGVEPWLQKDNEGKEVTIRKNLKPASIFLECENSLKRLGIDCIDLYQIHWPDSATPVEESWNAMIKLQEQGKVRAIGVSNFGPALMRQIHYLHPIASDQCGYSALQRQLEKETLPYCHSADISMLVYSPLERGLLTGKITPDHRFLPGDHRAQHRLFSQKSRQDVADALAKVQPIAEKHGASLAQVMINWTVQQKGVTAALVGARNAEQAQHNAQALAFTLSATELQLIRAAFDPVAVYG